MRLFYPEEDGIGFPRNAGGFLPDYVVSHKAASSGILFCSLEYRMIEK
jgi:hypothetical protein